MVSRSCETGGEGHVGKPGDVDQRMLVMTDGCGLLVCIYAFKLPSAVHNPNDKRGNKREGEQKGSGTLSPQRTTASEMLVRGPDAD